MGVRGQISVEYLVITGFIVFVVMGIISTAFFYSSEIQNAIRFNQLERFARKLTSSAESVFYSGEPSRITYTSYLPEGINQITLANQEVVFNVSTSAGIAIVSYSSNVPLEGNIPVSEGVKKLQLVANSDKVVVSHA